MIATLHFVALALTACGSRRERTDAAAVANASAAPTSMASSSRSGVPSPSASVATNCLEGQRALEQHAVSGGPTLVGPACSVDEDCACVDLPQAARTPPFCGFVVPKAVGGALRDENDRLAAAGCALSGTCPSAPCDAMCVPGPRAGYCDKRTPCREITVRADALVKRLNLGCQHDADCAGYPAGIAQDCGGVGNRASVAPLLALAREFRERSCAYAVNCAPRAATRPVCREGICGEAIR